MFYSKYITEVLLLGLHSQKLESEKLAVTCAVLLLWIGTMSITAQFSCDFMCKMV